MLGLDESPAVLWFTLLMLVAFAAYAYRASVRHRLRFGVTPWRLPPWLWSLLVFLSGLLGLIVFFIARATTRPSEAFSGGASVHLEQERPFHAAAVHDPYGLGSSHPPPAHLPPAGWYPDPGQRHELRYWDGKGWSDHVSDDGVRSLDPS